MNRRALTLSLTAALVLGAMPAATAEAGGPVRYGDSYTVRIFDDFIHDLCGIDTYTTVTERWTLKEFPDGSAIFHVTRTFVPDDPRIPVEKGAGTKFIAPDGTETVVGVPALIFEPGGGVRLIAAGWARFGDTVTTHGLDTYLDADLALLYCPADDQ